MCRDPPVSEAREQADKQQMLRAAQGFRYEFTTNPMKKSPPWFERFELTPPIRPGADNSPKAVSPLRITF